MTGESSTDLPDDGYEVPPDHQKALEKLRHDGVISDWEMMGTWDYTRARGPGHRMGIFTPEEIEETGERVYRLWMPKPEADD